MQLSPKSATRITALIILATSGATQAGDKVATVPPCIKNLVLTVKDLEPAPHFGYGKQENSLALTAEIKNLSAVESCSIVQMSCSFEENFKIIQSNPQFKIVTEKACFKNLPKLVTLAPK